MTSVCLIWWIAVSCIDRTNVRWREKSRNKWEIPMTFFPKSFHAVAIGLASCGLSSHILNSDCYANTRTHDIELKRLIRERIVQYFSKRTHRGPLWICEHNYLFCESKFGSVQAHVYAHRLSLHIIIRIINMCFTVLSVWIVVVLCGYGFSCCQPTSTLWISEKVAKTKTNTRISSVWINVRE